MLDKKTMRIICNICFGLLIAILILIFINTIIWKNQIRYKNNADGTVTLINYKDTSKNVIVPSEYSNKDVSAMGGFSLKNCKNMQELTLPKTITVMDSKALSGCESLQVLNIPINTWLSEHVKEYCPDNVEVRIQLPTKLM